MTDREMLEMAARAAGFRRMQDLDDVPYVSESEGGQDDFVAWNPLTDDGDALRLAGRLGFVVNIWNVARKTFAGDAESGLGWTEGHGSDPNAATRRAIFRAATEIGKQMEERRG